MVYVSCKECEQKDKCIEFMEEGCCLFDPSIERVIKAVKDSENEEEFVRKLQAIFVYLVGRYRI